MTTEKVSPRRVLVTGAAGRIGHAVCFELASHGMAITGMSQEGPFPPDCDRIVTGDVARPEVLATACAEVGAIVHLAAIPHPSLGTALEVYANNVVSTFAVLAAAGQRGIGRVVLASSINASGIPFNHHRVLPAYFPIDEQLPIDITDAYSLSKQSGEVAATMAARTWNLEVASLRFPLTATRSVLLDASAQATEDPRGKVREGWSYLEVGDAARAVCAALVRPIEGAVVIGLAARDTLIDVPTEHLLDRFAPDVPRRRPLPGRTSAVDTTRARTLLGFEAQVSLHEP